MSNDSNDYGFPRLSDDAVLILWNRTNVPLSQPPKETKLHRAQAIAAEVRARRFPPVQRITQKEE